MQISFLHLTQLLFKLLYLLPLSVISVSILTLILFKGFFILFFFSISSFLAWFSTRHRIVSCLDSSFANTLSQFHQSWKTLWLTLVPRLRYMICNADKMVDYINFMLLSESEDTSCLEPELVKSK